MPVHVRAADIAHEQSALVAFLRTYLSPIADDRRFEWLYRNNPDGEARAWIASDPDEGKIIGVAAAFPRRMFDSGRETKGYVLGDFCIHPEYRTMGPALALQKACLNDLAQDVETLAFDFPSVAMLSIYKRLKIEAQEQIVRFAKVLRVNHKVGRMVPEGAVTGLSTVLNLALRVRDSVRLPDGDWNFADESGPWGEEFTQSHDWRCPGVSTSRTAAYLNWRYAQNPLRRYTMLTARSEGRLAGYLVFHVDQQNGIVDDVLTCDDRVREALLIYGGSIARQQGVHTLSVPSLPRPSVKRALYACGFRPRESCPVILLRLSRQTQFLPHRGQWHLMDGDRES